MNETRRSGSLRLLLALALGLIVLGSATAMAGSGGPYTVSWWTIDGGGGTSAGGGYRLDGTAGQPDAGEMGGDGYRLVGGFWGGGFVEYQIYLPVVLRGGGR